MEIDPSEISLERIGIVTTDNGCVESVTLKLAVPPDSVVTRPDGGITRILGRVGLPKITYACPGETRAVSK